MTVFIERSPEAFDREGAMYITRHALTKPDTTFVLATGNTTLNMYALAADLHRELGVDYSRCKTSNLDEYVGVAAADPRSCRYRINEVLLNKINIKPENTYVPDGLILPPEQELDVFREKIECFGGIDLLVLSIGANGHIAFNEPGTPFDSSFRIAPLSEDTRRDKAALFGGLDTVPRFGITMGIRDIMMAREILLVAKGKSKAEAIRRIVRGPLDTDVPATVLALHPNVMVLVDTDAASFIR